MRLRDKAIHAMATFFLGAILAFVFLVVGSAMASETIPPDAARHRQDLTRQARMVWGIDAPVATFAGQIHQESAWRADARSPVGASGLAQFMPRTAEWISGIYPNELGENAPYNPTWAIRALVRYDMWLWQRLPVQDCCGRMWFVLRSYNGGLGYVLKEFKASGSHDPAQVGQQCGKFRSPASCRENLHYPRRIMMLEARYEQAGWGAGVCS